MSGCGLGEGVLVGVASVRVCGEDTPFSYKL